MPPRLASATRHLPRPIQTVGVIVRLLAFTLLRSQSLSHRHPKLSLIRAYAATLPRPPRDTTAYSASHNSAAQPAHSAGARTRPNPPTPTARVGRQARQRGQQPRWARGSPLRSVVDCDFVGQVNARTRQHDPTKRWITNMRRLHRLSVQNVTGAPTMRIAPPQTAGHVAHVLNHRQAPP